MNPFAPIITIAVALLLVWLAIFSDSSLLFQVYLSVTSIFMVLLVLVQKGRGGGLAGALGGPGGSSAFGAKAGDVFTRITILVAVVWGIFAIAAAYWAKNQGDAFGTGGGQLGRPPASNDAPASPGGDPATDGQPAAPAPPEPSTGPDLAPASGDEPSGESTAPATNAAEPASPPADSTP